MSLYLFEGYIFNITTHQLTQNDISIPLRPKAAQLLAFFILHQGDLLSKKAIAAAIWGQHHIPDHTLFQLISELRKLSPNVLIRTHPNQGYCWIAQTKPIGHLRKLLYAPPTASVPPRKASPSNPHLLPVNCGSAGGTSWLSTKISNFWRCPIEKRLHRSAIVSSGLAACIAFLLICLPLFYVADTTQGILPGPKALVKGILALDAGDNVAADAWFKFALEENPQAIEARLLLAESLYQQSRLRESADYLQPILGKSKANTIPASSYDKSIASDLMSRIHYKDGKLEKALEYAQKSILETPIAQCTEGILDQRIEYLFRILHTNQTPSFNPASEQRLSVNKENNQYLEQCNQLKDISVKSRSTCRHLPTTELHASHYGVSSTVRRIS